MRRPQGLLELGRERRATVALLDGGGDCYATFARWVRARRRWATKLAKGGLLR